MQQCFRALGFSAGGTVRLSALLGMLCLAPLLRAQDRLSAGGGGVHIPGGDHRSIYYMEFHFDLEMGGFQPMAGLLAAADGDQYYYAGFRKEFPLSERLRFIPSLCAGYFREGDRRDDLGGPLEFHTMLRLEYRPGQAFGMGLALGHISNAHIYNYNPGSNSISLHLSLPLGGKSRPNP